MNETFLKERIKKLQDLRSSLYKSTLPSFDKDEDTNKRLVEFNNEIDNTINSLTQAIYKLSDIEWN